MKNWMNMMMVEEPWTESDVFSRLSAAGVFSATCVYTGIPKSIDSSVFKPSSNTRELPSISFKMKSLENFIIISSDWL